MTEEISNAIKTLSLNAAEFHLLRNEDAEPLYHELLSCFVNGGDRRWWWESFVEPSETVLFADGTGYAKILDIVPDIKEHVWFVVEDDQLPFYPIYDATPEAIIKVIGECYGFEYYIIPKSKDWLLCENHHNYLVGVGSVVNEKLVQYIA